MNPLSKANYLQYASDYYGRVNRGYLHANPEHYDIVGRPKIGSMTEQIITSINKVNDTNKKHTLLDKIIKQQEKKELTKLQAFVNVYNQTTDKPISGADPNTILKEINKLISQKGFKASSPYDSPKVRQSIASINVAIDSFFSDGKVTFSGSKVKDMQPNEFMALYEIAQDILQYFAMQYRTEENDIIREIHSFPIRKIQGFLKDHSALYNKYLSNSGQTQTIPDPVLNDILQSVGAKNWGGRDARKTAVQVQSSFKGSARGGANQLQGVTLEKTIAGYVDDSDICGDVANLIKGLAEGKVMGKMVGNRQDQFKKQQKIDIEWSFTSTNEQKQKINLSSKVNTGSGGIEIHGGGGLDSYIARFEENAYSRPIANIFKNPNFRYFFANEFYGASMGGSVNTAFRNAIYNAIKVNVPTLLGVELEGKQVSMFNGVDFLNVNQTIIPVSTILKKMKSNLKDYEKVSAGMSINFNAESTSGNFLTSRSALLKQIPRAPFEKYYTNRTLMSQGFADMNNYINHIKIGVKLTSSLIEQSIREVTQGGS